MLADAAREPITFESLARLLLIWLALGITGASALLILRLAAPGSRGSMLPQQRQRAVPWEAVHVGLVVLVYLLWDGVSGLAFGRMSANLTEVERVERVVWAQLAAWPFQLGSILLALRFSAQAQLYQLGLVWHRPIENLTAAYAFWLVLTPLVFAVYLLSTLFWPVGLHPLELLVKDKPGGLTWAMIAVTVVIAAPVMEELVLRGVIQPWMTHSPQAADFAMLGALIVAIVRGITEPSWEPLVFLVTAGPGYLVFEFLMKRWLPRPGVARAIYASSLIFAALHHQAWPTPIALFFLSLGLGFLAYRTQSLIGPIAFHSLFNAVTLLELVMKQTATS